ncbi:MAG: HEPN domain-containing protein [Candidatus Nealsonbacteria bacterium]|nr:HEPN domain-containing protein [Candidatus Nealsonbacteria bacterium]
MIKNFEDCLKTGKIKKFSRGKSLAPKELRLAEEDLKIAKKSLKDGNYRWCIIQIYYSMFHSARALLYFKNYREHSHFCLNQAIKELYVKSGKLAVSFLEALSEAKNLREAADYYGEYSDLNAKKLLDKAKQFIKEAKEISLKP